MVAIRLWSNGTPGQLMQSNNGIKNGEVYIESVSRADNHTSPLPAIITVSETTRNVSFHNFESIPESDLPACSLFRTRSTFVEAAEPNRGVPLPSSIFRLLCRTRRIHERRGKRTKRMKNVVILEVVRCGAREDFMRDRMVDAWEAVGVVLISVLGVDEETAELAEELAVRDRAFPFNGPDVPRGTAVSTDDSEELDEWATADCRKLDCPRGVDGTMVCVEVVDNDEDEEEDGVGECGRGVGTREVEGEGDEGAGFLAAKASACWASNRDFRNYRSYE
ncbi:hypothetical protein NMY22_g18990 [Coprinellus aureogranulatus]|nr:hypothetical protein NMY22_g18990 [Coprinellus aureogranulatus]